MNTYTSNPPAYFTVLASGQLHCGHCVHNINSGFCNDCLDAHPQAMRGSRGVIWATEAELAATFPMFFTAARQQELLETKENAQRLREELAARLELSKVSIMTT